MEIDSTRKRLAMEIMHFDTIPPRWNPTEKIEQAYEVMAQFQKGLTRGSFSVDDWYCFLANVEWAGDSQGYPAERAGTIEFFLSLGRQVGDNPGPAVAAVLCHAFIAMLDARLKRRKKT